MQNIQFPVKFQFKIATFANDFTFCIHGTPLG